MATKARLYLKSKDTGYTNLMKNISSQTNSYTLVGFPLKGAVAPPTRIGSNHKPVETMEQMAMIAAYQEFGTSNIPSRPFIRNTINNNIDNIRAYSKRLGKKVIEGEMTPREEAEIIGEYICKLIKKEITTGDFAPLAESTINKKGHDQPLIDRRQMINSVQHIEVVSGSTGKKTYFSGENKI